MSEFVTHTGLVIPPLSVEGEDENKVYILVLRGDRDKELFRGSEQEATAKRDELITHYEERAKAETT